MELSKEEEEIIQKYRDGYRGVYWHVEDFHSYANKVEAASEVELYDRSKFNKALEAMVDKQDCSQGITWDTLEYYLDEMCRYKHGVKDV